MNILDGKVDMENLFQYVTVLFIKLTMLMTRRARQRSRRRSRERICAVRLARHVIYLVHHHSSCPRLRGPPLLQPRRSAASVHHSTPLDVRRASFSSSIAAVSMPPVSMVKK